MQTAEQNASLWPSGVTSDADSFTHRGISAEQLAEQYGTPLYVMDTVDVAERAHSFVQSARDAFANTTAHVSFAGKAFLSKEVARIVSEQGMYVDTCTWGEMQIALAAGVPGRRLVLHGNNKTDEEIRLAVEQGFDKIVIDEPGEPDRIARIARSLGKRARVMVRVTVGVHAGGHEYISTAHEDQKFGIALLPARSAGVDGVATDVGSADGSPAADDVQSTAFFDRVAHGPAVQTLHRVLELGEDLELVGIHSHIGSQIHDADAFIAAAERVMVLRRAFYATDGYVVPEIDLGGGYSVAYVPGDASMDVKATLERIAAAIHEDSARAGLPLPVVSFEPGRWIVAPAGYTLYRVGTVKRVALGEGRSRVYVSVDGGMSDNIRPALYGAEYTAEVVGRAASGGASGGAVRSPGETVQARIVGAHCESGDIIVHDIELPADVARGDLLAVPVTGAYGRTMASNYNQLLRPAVVAVDDHGSHVMMRRETVEDLLGLDVSE
ncbi:diaminopimelate decarboxylase [Alloscardovia macacae]|uniref:Diaminopimelate decarboxylase n=1 Tax=Alloscardovia macacae TaxID=1160091 RepID=A0A1Y2SYS0_9BIFI|nr:diaminopimelate decarboxylase [Alloscardovia macacae]OTA27442.1 diaminopimelate decarboxylase [Alloscardovia macacae]OTA29453.1 diaminopimelate decarboxylase [Alloscardovia macacae]